MGKARLLSLIGLFCCAAWAAAPCEARSRFVAGDYRHEGLRLESRSTVTTWERDGVRVFVADEGALLRQGSVRLAAPRMVVWFERARSERPDVRAAMVTVYAEGPSESAVRLVEGDGVRQCGAILMRFASDLSFTWDCPLRRSDEAVPSPLLTRAEGRFAGQVEAIWEEAPPALPRAELAAITDALKAEEVQFFIEERPMVAVFMGDVHGSYGNLELRADAAVLWYDPDRKVYEIYAHGGIRVSKLPGDAPARALPEGAPEVGEILEHLEADELYINPGAARGLATSPEVRLRDPRAPVELVYVFRGENAYLIDSHTLTVTRVSVTSCSFERPHYLLSAERLQVARRPPSTVLTGWDVRLRAGESQRTLLWVPFLATDLTERAYLLTDYAIGSSSKFGAFVQTTWRPLDLTGRPPWVNKWTVNLDYYGDRGPAAGTELGYEFGEGYPRHGGRLRGYYVSDTGSEDDTGLPVPRQNRGRAHVEHRSRLSPAWRLDGEFYRLSDSGFLREYFEADFEEEKPPESYLLLRYLRNSTYLALLYKEQVNDFLTQLEERPSADLQLIALPIGRLVYDGSLTVGYYDVEPNDELMPAPLDPPTLLRGFTEHRLGLPFSAGIFRFDPFVRAVGLAAGKSRRTPGAFADSEQSAGAGGGISVSTTLSRAFGLTSELLELNRLRHVVIPHAGIETLAMSGDSADFIQMDRNDAIDDATLGTVGLRQRLETKRERDGQWRSVNWIELDVALVGRSSDSVDPARGGDYVRADFEMQLTDAISLHSRDNRIALDGGSDFANFGFQLDFLPRCLLRFNYDRISGTSETLTADLSYELSDRYRLLLREQYELNSRGTGRDQHLETIVVLRRLLHNWVLDLGVHLEEANGETAVILGFGPAGWGVFTDPRRAVR